MYIGCTKRLQEYLIITPSVGSAAPLFSWSANLLTLNRRKVIAVVNDSCRYGFILYGVTAKMLRNLDDLILEGVRACLEEACVDPALVERYIADCKTPVYGKTANRITVARMNKFCERVEFFADEMNPADVHQKSLIGRINNDIFEIDKVIYTPARLLFQELGAYYSVENVCKCRVGIFDITLELESVCTRRVIIPMNYTFKKLHHVLQKLFNWENCHLHQFILETYPDGRRKTVLLPEIPEDDNGFEDETALLEGDTHLSDVFPDKTEIIYNYDFGDDWYHYIKLIEIKDDYDRAYPVCLNAEGDAPPEDVGGIGGFAELLRVLAEPSDPEYRKMKEWADSMGYEPIDLEKVNRRLKY